MCFPPQARQSPFDGPAGAAAATSAEDGRPDGVSSRPRVSEEFDNAVSQFMANLQRQNQPRNANQASKRASIGFPIPSATQTNSLVSVLQMQQAASLQAALLQAPALSRGGLPINSSTASASVSPAPSVSYLPFGHSSHLGNSAANFEQCLPAATFEHGFLEEDVEKKVRRIMSNRQSAKRSRQRKRDRLDELEEEVTALNQARQTAEQQLKEAERSMIQLRAANQRVRAELETIRSSVQCSVVQVPDLSNVDVEQRAGRSQFELGDSDARDEDGPSRKMRKIEKVESCQVTLDAESGPLPEEVTSVFSRDVTCNEGEDAMVKQLFGEDAMVALEASLCGMEGDGVVALDNENACLIGQQSGLEFLDESLVHSMLECLGRGDLVQF